MSNRSNLLSLSDVNIIFTYSFIFPEMCSPLVSLSVGVKCFNGKDDVDCSKPMPPGTRAEGECKPFYTQIRPPQYTEIVCKENGQWSYELFDCAPGKNLVF